MTFIDGDNSKSRIYGLTYYNCKIICGRLWWGFSLKKWYVCEPVFSLLF
jgi:hypothetical protein